MESVFTVVLWSGLSHGGGRFCGLLEGGGFCELLFCSVRA